MQDQPIFLAGIEASRLKGLDSLRWALQQLEQISESLAVSTVLQNNFPAERPSLRMVVKGTLPLEPEEVLQEISRMENEYVQKNRMLEPLRIFLLTYDQKVVLTPSLLLPHPQLVTSPAWLYCAAEVWRTYRHPILDLPLERLLNQVDTHHLEFFSQAKAVLTKGGGPVPL